MEIENCGALQVEKIVVKIITDMTISSQFPRLLQKNNSSSSSSSSRLEEKNYESSLLRVPTIYILENALGVRVCV